MSCGAPPDVDNATHHDTNYTYQSVAVYTCNDGYQRNNGSGIKSCSCDGIWVNADTNLTCQGMHIIKTLMCCNVYLIVWLQDVIYNLIFIGIRIFPQS